ncbi:MAG: penicillin-binding protein, partial [Candidatus Hydrogenedentales bacterium]
EDPYQAAQRLSVLLNMDENEIFDRLVRKTSSGDQMRDVPIKRYLSEEELHALGDLEARGIPGMRVKRESARFYPEESLAAHVLGYVNREHKGSEGVEAIYEEALKGIQGIHRSRVDRDRNLLASLTLEYVAPSGGDEIVLTIEKGIQSTLERELRAVMERCQASRAMGFIMDPKTGAVLAMACLPSFDPNAYWEYSPEVRKNRAITDVFEPGSSFKIVTASAALEHGAVTPETLINCEGGAWTAFGRRYIKDVHKMQIVLFSEAFAESSNIGIIKVADMLAAKAGPEILDTWIQRFGFGKATSRDFLAESSGIYRPYAKWSKLSMISLPMGQEVAVTMPQLARAFSAVANGGVLVEPHLVDRVLDRDGNVKYAFEPGPEQRVMSEQTSATMRQLCYQVIAHGTGKRAAIPEYKAGGKTGTAQIAKAEGGGYYTDQHTAVFAGFAPITDPRICVVIVVHNPQSKIYYGGYVCGPVFREVARDTLIRLNCPEEPMGADYDAPAPADADADILVAQAQPPQTLTLKGEEQQVETGQEPSFVPEYLVVAGAVLPNLQGYTKRQAQQELAALGVQWDAQGSGWVAAQDPAPGTPLHQVERCRLVFSSKANETLYDVARPTPPARM